MIRRLLLLTLLLGSGLAVTAQERPADPAPTYAVDERKDLELLNLKKQLTEATRTIAALQANVGTCLGQLGQYQFDQNAKALDAETRALQERIEKRSGYVWDPSTGFGAKKPPPTAKPSGR